MRRQRRNRQSRKRMRAHRANAAPPAIWTRATTITTGAGTTCRAAGSVLTTAGGSACLAAVATPPSRHRKAGGQSTAVRIGLVLWLAPVTLTEGISGPSSSTRNAQDRRRQWRSVGVGLGAEDIRQ